LITLGGLMSELVSVVTATWGRPNALLKHCIPSVMRQTHRPIEHLIVTDGFDEDLRDVLVGEGYTTDGTVTDDGVHRRLVWLGRNWTSRISDPGVGSVPRAVGAWMASGEFICYFDDDNDFRADHVEKLLGVIAYQGVDIALCPWADHPNASSCVADTNTFLHRADVLKHGTWPLSPYNADYSLVWGWTHDKSVSWGYHDEQTVTLNRLNGGRGARE
jgi:glycosyltransferase involved in cell wall biosynthesis